MAEVTAADILTDYDVTVYEGSDSNAKKFGLGTKIQDLQTDSVATSANVATLQAEVATLQESWPEASVIAYQGSRTVTQLNALTPTTGDAYVATSAGTPTAGASDALVVGDVAEYDGTQWKKIVSASGGFVPADTVLIVGTGTLVSPLTNVTDRKKLATFDGTSNTPAVATAADGDVRAVVTTSIYAGRVYQYDTTDGWVQFAAPLSSATPAAVGTAAAGTSTSASRGDHVHAHGNLAGGTFHANAVAAGAAGFLTGADKSKLDNLPLTTNGTGASLVGIEDALGLITATTVEGALAEFAAMLNGALVGVHVKRVGLWTYSFGVNGGGQGNITLTGPTLPIGAMVTKAYYLVTTPITSGGAATIALRIKADADLLAAAILATNGGAGSHEGTPFTPPIVLTGASALILQVANADLTAGVARFWVEYVI